jgi:hypothetical protein
MHRRRYLKTAIGGGLVIGIAPLAHMHAAAQYPYDRLVVGSMDAPAQGSAMASLPSTIRAMSWKSPLS